MNHNESYRLVEMAIDGQGRESLVFEWEATSRGAALIMFNAERKQPWMMQALKAGTARLKVVAA